VPYNQDGMFMFKVVRTKKIKITTVTAAFILATTIPILSFYTTKALAEGTNQFNIEQGLDSSTVLFADILNSGETINISVCSTTNISIWNTNGTPADNLDDTVLVAASSFTANLACGSALPNPITTAYKYTPASIGTYRIQISNFQARYDFSATPDNITDPNPNTASGRIWSYKWFMNTGSFAEAKATNLDMYVLVPASAPGENFVWKLDLNNFSGNVYYLAANSLGLDAPYSGLSATNASSVTPEFPIYLGFPATANNGSNSVPTISNARFVDDLDEDNIFSPNGTVAVQDTGNFKFDTNINNANYAITIDTNQDGVFGTGDRLLLGKANNGSNTVNWDGTYPNGDPVSSGVFRAQIQVRSGEYHFIANDVETSGGTNDGGSTWANGLTIYRAIDANTTENTKVYWDDKTELSAFTDSRSNLPLGVTSGSLVDSDSDGRADGFHTWGNFTGSGLGNNNNIDTYVYGPSSTATVNIAVSPDESGDTDGVPSNTELGAENFGDGNGDSLPDYLQSDVTSLNNDVSNSYNTLSSTGTSCDQLSNVAIYAENQLSSNDSKYDYPVGLFNFTLTCLNPGDTANITVYYDKVYDTSTWTARKFNNGVYTNIPGAVFSTATSGGNTVTTLSYSVQDGGDLDADGLANGVIIDPVGPGILGTTTTAPAAIGSPKTGIQRHNVLAKELAGIIGLGMSMSFIIFENLKNRSIVKK